MPSSRVSLLLTLILLIPLVASCTPQNNPGLTPGITVDSSSSSLQASESPLPSVTDFPIQPTQTPKPTRATGSPTNSQGGIAASQNLSYEVTSHPIDVILGCPTNNSITVSVLTYQDSEGYIEYGPEPDHFTSQTPLAALSANQPMEILVTGLQANTTYAYRVRYRFGSMENFAATKTETFSTQRSAGSTFTFAVQADSHLDTNSSIPVYLQTLENEYADNPDFMIDLGDTFMTDKYKPYTDAQPQYLAQRYYLSLIGQTAPIFLALGNHDGEGALKGNSGNDMSIWSAGLRTQLFPNPTPDGFYAGNAPPEENVGNLENYYAWEWGDALFIVLDPYWFTPPQSGETDLWNPTLGEAQYQWLKATLEASRAQWKFIFIHQLIGGADKNGRGGVEVAGFYEWGGQNADGSSGFVQQRPGWAMPIHQLLVANHVTGVFHGHDHLFIKQELDGIIYQVVPQPSALRSNGSNSAAEYGYLSGDILGSSGHLRVTVTSETVTVEYVRAYTLQDETPAQQNGQVDASYVIH
jgi:hypothetical protein